MATMTHPAACTVQRQVALEHANRIRLGRADLRRDLFAGTVTAADVIRDVPDCALSWELADMLGSQRRWGPKRVNAFLARLARRQTPISEHRRLGHLTTRERRILIDALESR